MVALLVNVNSAAEFSKLLSIRAAGDSEIRLSGDTGQEFTAECF